MVHSICRNCKWSACISLYRQSKGYFRRSKNCMLLSWSEWVISGKRFLRWLRLSSLSASPIYTQPNKGVFSFLAASSTSESNFILFCTSLTLNKFFLSLSLSLQQGCDIVTSFTQTQQELMLFV